MTRVPDDRERVLPQPRRLDEFRRSLPEQLSLFQLPSPGRHSNLVGLYDAAPKYLHYRPERVNNRIPEPLQRTFDYRNIEYNLIVTPALIKDNDGVWRDYLPGEREELIEDALRKLAASGQGVFLEDPRLPESDLLRDLASVFFTLRQLQGELASRGHSYDLRQLKDAIDICARSTLILESRQIGFSMSYPFFIGRTFVTRGEYLARGDARCFVRFHPLISISINERAFRRYDYELSMKYRRVLSRWLHKRLSDRFTQASRGTKFSILLSTILSSSGLRRYESLSNNIREIKIALDEMKALGTLAGYDVEPRKAGRKIVDALFSLEASDSFSAEMIDHNRIQQAIRQSISPLELQAAPADVQPVASAGNSSRKHRRR